MPGESYTSPVTGETYTVPTYEDPADAPIAFKDFADTITGGGGIDIPATRVDAVVQTLDGSTWAEGMALSVVSEVPADSEGQVGDVVFVSGKSPAPSGAANFTDTATGNYTQNGVNYKYLTVTGTQSVTFDVAGFIDLMLVSGGGAGGAGTYGNASGGGAGSYIVQTDLYVPVGIGIIEIGAGGAGTSDAMGTNGTYSSLVLGGLSIKGIGGGAGATGQSGSSNPGGSGGAPRTASATLISGKGLLGGNDASTSNPGGGGGSGSAGSGVTGGSPTTNSITGIAVDYAAGGRSGTNNEPGGNNTGTGGSGATSSTVGVAGGSGIAVIRVVV